MAWTVDAARGAAVGPELAVEDDAAVAPGDGAPVEDDAAVHGSAVGPGDGAAFGGGLAFRRASS